MPSSQVYPGVYVQDGPTGPRTISGVPTSITAFLGRSLRGPISKPIQIQSFATFEHIFGGLWIESTMSYAVFQFFVNGGTDALIVRIHKNATAATGKADTLNLIAANPGEWGNHLRVRIDHHAQPEIIAEQLFDLTVRDEINGTTETIGNVSVLQTHPRYIGTVLEEESDLVRVLGVVPATRPAASPSADPQDDPFEKEFGSTAFNLDGSDGETITDDEIVGNEKSRTGLYALDEAEMFNLLCIPPLASNTEVDSETWKRAAAYCQRRRAMVIIDTPADWSSKAPISISGVGREVNRLRETIGQSAAPNAAAYFPRLRMADPVSDNRLADFAPCGAVAGIIARTDAQRGVWKAPAGIDASIVGVIGITYTMTDAQNGGLNPLGLNCLRSLAAAGPVVWGARTLAGADVLASEWEYIPVRHLALYVEESLFRGTKWAVFEPNDEPLWAQIRSSVETFMDHLFRQGAFAGAKSRDAYYVKCDREIMTQNDLDLGIVRIIVGFAPLKPGEFVVVKIQQNSGQVPA